MRPAPSIPRLGVAALAAALVVLATPARAGDPARNEAGLAAALDDFHAAAAAADGPRYFAHFAPDAVFLGTDAKERWTLAEFQAFAKPYFDKGKGWTYSAKTRNVRLAPSGDVAWFDEALDSQAFGECRGSGVAMWIDGAWKIAQYNLTIPIPNDLAREVVERIRGVTSAAAETVVLVVRHAEREDGPRDADPPLTEKGRRRAAALARAIRSLPLKAIYTTDTRRTRETMAPAAAAFHLDPATYDAKDPAALSALLRAAPAGSEALVCGHAKSIPSLLASLGVKESVGDLEDEHDGLFVVTLSPGRPSRLLHLHYGE